MDLPLGKPPLHPNIKGPKFSKGIMFGPNKYRRKTLRNNNVKKIQNVFSNKKNKTKNNRNNKKLQQHRRLEAESIFSLNNSRIQPTLNIAKLHGIIERGLDPSEIDTLIPSEFDYIIQKMSENA